MNDLKLAMTQAPVLAMPDFTQPFIIECDACGIGLDVVLLQTERPISFLSQTLEGRHLLLCTYEKELLALIVVTKKWEQYLLERSFIIKTDHQSLKYLLEQRLGKGIQINGNKASGV